jgi:hypothetical protein
MDSDGFVSIKELAQRLGMDRSHARRYVLKLGYSFHKRRTSDSGSQLTLCVTHLRPRKSALIEPIKDLRHPLSSWYLMLVCFTLFSLFLNLTQEDSSSGLRKVWNRGLGSTGQQLRQRKFFRLGPASVPGN